MQWNPFRRGPLALLESFGPDGGLWPQWPSGSGGTLWPQWDPLGPLCVQAMFVLRGDGDTRPSNVRLRGGQEDPPALMISVSRRLLKRQLPPYLASFSSFKFLLLSMRKEVQ